MAKILSGHNEKVMKCAWCLLRLLPHQASHLNSIVSTRLLSRSSVKFSLYETLGISSASTQADIKTAYYKLSKTYHPDKNKGSENAAQKFRDITAAYEILGNYRLRRLYDKGVRPADSSKNYNPTKEDIQEMAHEEEDDAQTKFYKQHMRRSERPLASGRAPIYNYDEWTDNHYSASFARSQSNKKAYQDNMDMGNSLTDAYGITVFWAFLFVTGVLFLNYCFRGSDKKPTRPPS